MSTIDERRERASAGVDFGSHCRVFKTFREANMPGGRPTRPIELEWGEPGVKMGQ